VAAWVITARRRTFFQSKCPFCIYLGQTLRAKQLCHAELIPPIPSGPAGNSSAKGARINLRIARSSALKFIRCAGRGLPQAVPRAGHLLRVSGHMARGARIPRLYANEKKKTTHDCLAAGILLE
jgi:hypothetical protein